VYNDLPEPTEAEDDMLDQAYGLTHTSRLGCQIIVEKKHEGMNVRLPVATRNFYVVINYLFILLVLYTKMDLT
jgi:hypothetical protein